MYAALKRLIDTRLFQLRGPQPGAIVLVQRRIFILPTRHGVVFATVLALMLLGSVNYTLSLGFLLTFLLGAMGVNAMLYTFRNLARLRIAPGRTQPVFAGETAYFTVCITNASVTDRYSIGLTRDRRHAVFVNAPQSQTALASVPVAAPRRGVLRPGRITLFTRYPLGLFHAWAYLELDMRCLVYPRPEAARMTPSPPTPEAGEGFEYGAGHEDFAGLRPYHLGDAPRHVAWKAAARDQGLLTKQFSGRADAELWFDWNKLPAQLDVEARLSRLARWVLDAHAAGRAFGLRLPGVTLAPAAGRAQRDRCLEALALFGIEDGER